MPELVYQSISPPPLGAFDQFFSLSAGGSFSKDFQISSGVAARAAVNPIISPRKKMVADTNLPKYSIEDFSLGLLRFRWRLSLLRAGDAVK